MLLLLKIRFRVEPSLNYLAVDSVSHRTVVELAAGSLHRISGLKTVECARQFDRAALASQRPASNSSC